MNEQIFVLNSQKKNTNHILHLLLCIPTFGLWLIVWFFVANSNASHNQKIQKQIDQVLGYKMQGLSDVETYKKVNADEAARKQRSDQIFMVTVIVLTFAAFFLLK
ncbi:hypothetical protein [Pseudomonas sp. LFM046]|uniref:hypothetical protein n=1 Tax=Pseudomonas sp. LFM046 TaxID=1608357 RepID=UPI0005CFB803|nr:hypothetical protein [Pseudomonas sp. LFM046]